VLTSLRIIHDGVPARCAPVVDSYGTCSGLPQELKAKHPALPSAPPSWFELARHGGGTLSSWLSPADGVPFVLHPVTQLITYISTGKPALARDGPHLLLLTSAPPSCAWMVPCA
jgi:hypothetical protein